MDAAREPRPGADDVFAGARGPSGAFTPDVTGRPVWRLLVRGIGVYLPGWSEPSGAVTVAVPNGRSAFGEPPRDGFGGTQWDVPESALPPGFGPPAFVNGESGFGLHLPDRRKGLEPDREIYVRGQENPSFGIVIAGPASAVGSRVVDADGLVRFARKLTFEELFEPGDASSVPYAVRAARAVQNVVLLDRGSGVGLCAEADQESGTARCPVFVRIGGPAERNVRAYALAPQAVSSHS
ncbi:hypothetical protein [Actinomadura gamaensis]|uniref:Uncharacterized protein n=1 Tax=Actinomadura gamaensis TaxID=1763541 RepID=A0ABV9TRV4_9ACTN